MSGKPANTVRRASPELVAVIALGVTILLAVLGQAAWLDEKIERVDTRLSTQIDGVDTRLSEKIDRVDAKLSEKIDRVDAQLTAQIENLQLGQAAIRERLAALEAHSASANSPVGAQGVNTQPAS